MLKRNQASLLIIFDFDIFRLIPKTNQLMRKDWWLRNQPHSMNNGLKNLVRTTETVIPRYNRVPFSIALD
jgi:hypothetical protein